MNAATIGFSDHSGLQATDRAPMPFEVAYAMETRNVLRCVALKSPFVHRGVPEQHAERQQNRPLGLQLL